MQIVLGSPDVRIGLKYEPSSRITYDQWVGNKTRGGQWQMENYDEIEHDIAIIEVKSQSRTWRKFLLDWTYICVAFEALEEGEQTSGKADSIVQEKIHQALQ